MPHAPLGVLDIPLVTGNDVDMDVENTLPGGQPHVNPDIVAIRVKFPVDAPFLLINQVYAGRHLVLRQVEKARDMPLRDDQDMTRADRIGVTGTVCELMHQ